MTLLDFIPTRSPGYVRPFHLSRPCAALDKIGSEPMRRIFWHGPRCGLTQTIMAATVMRSELTHAYAAPRRDLTDRVLAHLGRNVRPADRPVAGIVVAGAYFLDGYTPDEAQWEHILTRVTPTASIFIFANEKTFGESPHAEIRADALRHGFTAGWV